MKAPFTDEQVNNLNEFQLSGAMHPFTCINSDCRSKEHGGILYAKKDGWHCHTCDYTQLWAHDNMGNGVFMDAHKKMIEHFKNPIKKVNPPLMG